MRHPMLREVWLPRIVRVETGALEALPDLVSRVQTSRGACLVLSGAGGSSPWGTKASALLADAGILVAHRITETSRIDGIAPLFGRLNGVGVVVGVGGGRVLDVAKWVAGRGGIPFMSVPTALSHDGIGSPIVSLIDTSGARRSYGTTPPAAIVIDLEVVRGAPTDSIRAGIGDLFSNITALLDWRLAASVGEEFDEYSAVIAEQAVKSLWSSSLTVDDLDHVTNQLAHGLVMNGLAMILADSSRPCSGAEHLISHSLDRLLGVNSRPHGLQVALGMLLSAAAHGEQLDVYRRAFERFGLPVHPSDVGLSTETMISALENAPATRPDRYTILSDLAGDGQARRLVSRAFDGLG